MTRSHLLAAAAQVFARQGFHGASIDDVAAAAGFTKGAVYSNFKNKEELFLAVLDDHSRKEREIVAETLQAAASMGAEERAGLFADLTSRLLWGDDDWQLLFLEFSLYAARNPGARAKLAERTRLDRELLAPMLAAELERDGTEPTMPVERITALLLALFNGIALQHATDPENADRELVESAITFVGEVFDAWPKRVEARPDG